MGEVILNLTQHLATNDQKEAGVIDLEEPERAVLKKLLTFDDIPTPLEVHQRAREIAELACSYIPDNGNEAMIGGAPFLMAPLEWYLKASSIYPVYAFSRRENVETTLPDGKVVKMNIFKHVGFVYAVP